MAFDFGTYGAFLECDFDLAMPKRSRALLSRVGLRIVSHTFFSLQMTVPLAPPWYKHTEVSSMLMRNGSISGGTRLAAKLHRSHIAKAYQSWPDPLVPRPPKGPKPLRQHPAPRLGRRTPSFGPHTFGQGSALLLGPLKNIASKRGNISASALCHR